MIGVGVSALASGRRHPGLVDLVPLLSRMPLLNGVVMAIGRSSAP
ncbi:hypothetical protein ACU4GD_24965 [Cupriavidus basilensis]